MTEEMKKRKQQRKNIELILCFMLKDIHYLKSFMAVFLLA